MGQEEILIVRSFSHFKLIVVPSRRSLSLRHYSQNIALFLDTYLNLEKLQTYPQHSSRKNILKNVNTVMHV